MDLIVDGGTVNEWGEYDWPICESHVFHTQSCMDLRSSDVQANRRAASMDRRDDIHQSMTGR